MSPAPRPAGKIRRQAEINMKGASSKGERRAGAINKSAPFQKSKTRCAFFFSKKGCRRGDNCRYSHEADEKNELLDAVVQVQASTSSEDVNNNDAPLSSRLRISASKNERDDEVHGKHSKKRVQQYAARGGRSSPNNGRRSPQDRNDKNSIECTSTSSSPSSSNNTHCTLDIEREDSNAIVLMALLSQVQTAMKQNAALHDTLTHLEEQINSATTSAMNRNRLSRSSNGNDITGQDGKIEDEAGSFSDTVVDDEDRDPVEEPANVEKTSNRGRGNHSANVVTPMKSGSEGEKSVDEAIRPVDNGENRRMVSSVGRADVRGEQGGLVETQRRQKDEVAHHRSKQEERDIVHQDDSEWACPMCTLINQQSSWTCVVCGSTASGEEEDHEDEIPPLSSTTLSTSKSDAANTYMPQELQQYLSRKKREKCERTKAFACERKKEEGRVAAEAEKKRQFQIEFAGQVNMEKCDMVVKQSALVNVEQNVRNSKSRSSLNADSAPFTPFSARVVSKSVLDARSAPFLPSRREAADGPSPSQHIVKGVVLDASSAPFLPSRREAADGSSPSRHVSRELPQALRETKVDSVQLKQKKDENCDEMVVNDSRVMTTTKLEVRKHKMNPSREFATTTSCKPTNMNVQSVKNGMPKVVDQLSYYIKNERAYLGREVYSDGIPTGRAVSPIFSMLQDESTAEKGRKLLVLEPAELVLKEEYNKLVIQKTSLKEEIQEDVVKIEKMGEEIAKLAQNRELFDERGKHIEEEVEKKLETSKKEELRKMTVESKKLQEEKRKLLGKWDVKDILVGGKDILVGGVGTLVGVNKRKEDKITEEEEMSEEDKKKRIDEIDIKLVDLASRTRKEIEKHEKKFEAEEKREKEINERRIVNEAKKIDELQQLIESSEASIKSQKKRLAILHWMILIKKNQLQRLRQDISCIKSDVVEEYDESSENEGSFHINNSRDERGFTVLMIAAQNNDCLTAQTCFDLGADANVKSPEGLTAIDYSFFFEHKRVTNLILRNGGSLPQKQIGAWNSLHSMAPHSADSSRSWDDALKVAESAALPAETLMESPEQCEADADKRMNILTAEERSNMDFTCFESRLIDQNISSNSIQRVVLLEQKVYNWCVCADPTTRSNFIDVLEGLNPSSTHRPGVKATDIHRRAIVGTTTTFEVLASRFDDMSNQKGAKKDQVVIFSPFVSGEVEGVTSIGVLVWAVAPDSEASLYKTLVANTEFMRHKVALEDRFLEHRDGLLKLGKDMHLLDLQSTSVWTTATMDLHVLNVDRGDLERIGCQGFFAKKRIVHSEELVNKAIFRTSRAEASKNEDILSSERLDMSSLVSGGAGTGKTLLMIRKVAREESTRHILVVTRLPRLVDVIKTAVEEERSGSVENLSFTTYDDLLQLLARRVVPDDDSLCESFVQFNRVRFDCDESNISFSRQFVDTFLNSKERKKMRNFEIEPSTLWHSIIVIKSNSSCATTKKPLILEDYLALPISFGLTETQRRLCYDLFLKYEDWRLSRDYWDEMDRVLYVLTHGPSVFREGKFISWSTRVNRFGETNLLDDEGMPLYPFFYDVVCADEAQDFTEIDLLLFAKMSASIRSLFLSADVAQSVEVGVNMRATTVNDVVYSLVKDGKQKVKDVLQYIDLQTNHRTHAQNLAIGQAVRSILARSFQIPMTHESALINGELPRTMLIKKIRDLADVSVFQGGNIVFISPDEKVHELRLQFQALEIHNDVFGVREAKGLEFDACALIGFFGHFEELGSKEEWQNVLRWLSSSSNITKTAETGEKINGVMLGDCDYRLSAPKVSDEAMMLYTGLTRARNHLYLIEVEDTCKEKKQGQGKPLAQFAFRRLKELRLAKPVISIKEGNGQNVEMTPAEHKARGILYITQALSMSRNMKPFQNVKDKFMEAMSRFAPGKGNDRDLLDKCEKHLDALTKMNSLMEFVKESFLVGGHYDLQGKFPDVLEFEQLASEFFSLFLCDSFLVWEVHRVRLLIEEVFSRTPYETHFKSICATIKELEQAV